MKAKLPLAMVLAIVLVSCQTPGLGVWDDGRFTILQYNVQNLFDTKLTGNEYPEFAPDAPYWDEKRYLQRLSRLAELIGQAVPGGPDLVVLCEVESVQVVEDLVDLYLFRLGYREFAISGDDWSAIQTVVLSRGPILEVRRHSPSASGKLYRSILDVHVELGSSQLRILAGHWKSKAGDGDGGVAGRQAASKLSATLARQNAEAGGPPLVLTGDLNANWDESLDLPPQQVSLVVPASPAGLQAGLIGLSGVLSQLDAFAPVLYCPWPAWLAAGGVGSYFYGDGWETIDNMLVDPRIVQQSQHFSADYGLVFESFEVLNFEQLVSDRGKPMRYIHRSSSGYSDHLPLLLSLKEG